MSNIRNSARTARLILMSLQMTFLCLFEVNLPIFSDKFLLACCR